MKLSNDERMHRSAARTRRLLQAIRAGRVYTGDQAADMLGVSLPTVRTMVRVLRAQGIDIVTPRGGKWRVIEGEKI